MADDAEVVGETAATYARARGARLVAERPRVGMQAALSRVASGPIFFGFGLSTFAHHAKEARSFDRDGLPSPSLFAGAIGTLELSLGFLLVVGLATRLVAAALAGDMVGAIATPAGWRAARSSSGSRRRSSS